jgi:hypothetical protein
VAMAVKTKNSHPITAQYTASEFKEILNIMQLPTVEPEMHNFKYGSTKEHK